MVLKNAYFFLVLSTCLYLIQANLNDTEVDSIKLSICVFKEAQSSIQCNSTLGSQECQVKAENIPKNFTLYAIGEAKAANVPQELVWFRLYPRKVDNSGWWYYEFNRNAKMSLHPKEKHSVNDIGFILLNSQCWNKMNPIIRASETFEIIKTEKMNKELFSKSFFKVKMIGMITVV